MRCFFISPKGDNSELVSIISSNEIKNPMSLYNFIYPRLLKEIHGNWIDIGEDPIESMMEYIFEKGYFNVFCKGVTVYEDGSFRLHPLISLNLGKLGIYDDCY